MDMEFPSLIINSCVSEYLHFPVNTLENNSKTSWLPVNFIPETGFWVHNINIFLLLVFGYFQSGMALFLFLSFFKIFWTIAQLSVVPQSNSYFNILALKLVI